MHGLPHILTMHFIKSLLPVAEGDLIFNVGLKDGRLAPEFGVDFARIPGRQMVNLTVT